MYACRAERCAFRYLDVVRSEQVRICLFALQTRSAEPHCLIGSGMVLSSTWSTLMLLEMGAVFWDVMKIWSACLSRFRFGLQHPLRHAQESPIS